jgi:hypothetical protein
MAFLRSHLHYCGYEGRWNDVGCISAGWKVNDWEWLMFVEPEVAICHCQPGNYVNTVRRHNSFSTTPWRCKEEWRNNSTINIRSKWRWVIGFTPVVALIQSKQPSLRTGWDVVWAPELVRRLWKREKDLAQWRETKCDTWAARLVVWSLYQLACIKQTNKLRGP